MFKSQFCNVCVHIRMNKVPRKVWKRSNFVLEKSGKLQSDFYTNPAMGLQSLVILIIKLMVGCHYVVWLCQPVFLVFGGIRWS